MSRRFVIECRSPVHPCKCPDLTGTYPGRDGDHHPKCPWVDEWRWHRLGEKGTWGPRATPQEAAVKCLRWTGLTGIPAMRVLDGPTGPVVWQYAGSRGEVEEILPPWHEAAIKAARAQLEADDDALPEGSGVVDVQESLF